MARCECGALYVPTGEDITIAFTEGGVSTYMSLEHKSDALISDEQKLVSYGYTQTFPSITPTLVSIQFGGIENLIATGMMKFIVRKGDIKIVEKYFGTNGDDWTLPLLGGRPTVTASCSDILNSVDVSDSKIEIEIVSVCDLSPGDCCGNTVDISFRNMINTLCIEDVTTTRPPDHFSWRYSIDGDNCRQDLNGPFLSYLECYDSLDLNREEEETTTSTTCYPDDPSCTTEPPPTTTTLVPPNPNVYNWSVQQEFYPSGNAGDMINHIAMSHDGSTIALEDTVGMLTAEKHFRVMKLNSECEWYQLGENVVGDWFSLSMTANGSGVVGGKGDDNTFYAYEWNGTNWVASGTPFSVGNGTDASAAQITPDGKYIAASNYKHQSNRGTIEVREWNGSDWSMKGAADEMLGSSNNRYSYDICISNDGNTILGSPAPSAAGPAVRAWMWDGLNWVAKGQSIYPDAGIGESSQGDVTMAGDGNRITVGCDSTKQGGTGNSNAGSVKVFNYNDNTLVWDEIQVIYGDDGNYKLGSDRSSSMSNDGTKLLVTQLEIDRVTMYEWDESQYIKAKSDADLTIPDGDQNRKWGVRTAISANGLAYAASTSAGASGVCRVVDSNGYLCDGIATTPPPPTTAPPTTPPPTTPPPPTTTTTTVDPPFVPQYDNIFVSAPNFGGCYTRTGTTNGKHSYIRVSGPRTFTIRYEGNVWIIFQTAPVQETANNPPFRNVTPFNSLSPPQTGWLTTSNDPAPMSLTYSNC